MMKIKMKLFLFLLMNVSLYPQDITKKSYEQKDLILQVHLNKKEFNFIKSQSSFTKNDWDSTLIYTMKQLSIDRNKKIEDYCHYFRGVSFYNKKIFHEAIKELNSTSNNFKLIAYRYFYLGASFLELKKFDLALKYFILSEKESVKINDLEILANACNGIGSTNIYLKKYSLAEKYLIKNLELNIQIKKNERICSSYMNLANLYYEQYKDKEAIYFFKKSYELSKKSKDIKLKYLASKNIAAVEENLSNFKQALMYRKESEKWKDSLYNQNKIWAVADYEKKYAVAQKQKQISVLKVENELKNTQRNTMFFSTVGLLLLLTGGVYVYGQKVKNAKIILNQKEKLDELNATKDQLFSIVSHDLRSSVNALKTSNTKLTSSLESKKYDELDRLLHQNSAIANGAYSLLDNLLHWALLQTQQLYFHKDSVHLYSIVQQIEYSYKPLLLEKTIAFENEVSKNCFIFVDLDSLKIILRNLLDNAIKFSPEHSSIRFYSLDTPSEFHQLIIEDQGIGMRPETIAELLEDNELLAKKSNSEIIGTGLGMQLCKQMIKKNGGTLAIESELNKGTKMILSFPKTV